MTVDHHFHLCFKKGSTPPFGLLCAGRNWSVVVTKQLTSTIALSSNFAGLQLQIEYVSSGTLKPGPIKTRHHSRRQIKQIARSIVEHGFLVPAIIYGDNIIACGNARVEAALLARLELIPVIRAQHLSAEQMRLFASADNKLTEGASWDFDALKAEFADVAVLAPELDQDSSGFSITERDIIIGRHEADLLADLDDAPPHDEESPITRPGDIFICGEHRVGCGDATDADFIGRVVGDQKVRTVASDSPFNVPIGGHVSGLGEHQHAEFAMASGEMSDAEFTNFLIRAIGAVRAHLVDGALLYLFMDWRHIAQLLAAAEQSELGYLNLLVWAKTNAGMGSFYRSAHELIGVFKSGRAPHRNNVELGRHGRYRTNVLHYPGMNTFSKGRNKALESHPTVKPVALMADLILDSSAPDEVILDPFGGSGTTLIAAEKTDRKACLVEIDPGYVDVIVRRFEAATGQTATLEETGQTFAEVESERRGAE